MSRWPYRIPPKEAGRRVLVLITGVIVGAKAVTSYYNPSEVKYTVVWL